MILDNFFGRTSQSPQNATTLETVNLPGVQLAHESAAEKLAVVDRCINVLSDSIGKMPSYVLEGSTRERKQLPILDLLNVRPNEAMTPFIQRKMLEICRLTKPGGAYEWIIRDPISLKPVELIPIPSELVSPWRDLGGKVWYDVTHPYNGGRMRLRSEDVLHYKAYSPDGFRSIPVLTRAAQTIAAGLAAQAYQESYYESGGQPAGILSTDADLGGNVKVGGKDTGVSRKDALRKEWEKVHWGPSNAYRIAILDHGLKYVPITATMADAKFLESHDVTVMDICNFFGVPAYKVNAGKQSYSSNEQNAIEYVTGTLHPNVVQYEQERTWKLLLPSQRRAGLELHMNMLVELRGDFGSRANWYRQMREIGAYSVNDILAHEDLPDVPGGDSRYASWNYGPLEQWEELSVARNGGGESTSESTVKRQRDQ